MLRNSDISHLCLLSFSLEEFILFTISSIFDLFEFCFLKDAALKLGIAGLRIMSCFFIYSVLFFVLSSFYSSGTSFIS